MMSIGDVDDEHDDVDDDHDGAATCTKFKVAVLWMCGCVDRMIR